MDLLTPTIERRATQKFCHVGSRNYCCKLCLMGPCHFPSDESTGVCGARRSLVVARNLLRMAIGGTAAHCGHANTLHEYFNEELCSTPVQSKAPNYLLQIWQNLGISLPHHSHGHFKAISEAMHLSAMGVNGDYADVLKWVIYMGILDGYYGLYPATEIEDKYYGKPAVHSGKLNLNCISTSKVNIALHGHEPMIAEAIIEQACQHNNVNIIGVCCTGASMLARHNVPQAAHFLLQEDVISTGLIETMVIDAQCVLPSVSDMCECFHTKLITTSPIGRQPKASHYEISSPEIASSVAKKIIEDSIDNYKNRNPDHEMLFNVHQSQPKDAVVGYTEESFPVDETADRLADDTCKGIIAVVGCANPRVDIENWVQAFKQISRDYIILTTGCMAFEFGRRGLLDGKRFFHLGSCVNNSRIAEIFKRIAKKLNKPIHELNFIVSAPAPVTEKALSIGLFFVSLGCSLHVGYSSFISSDTTVASTLVSVMQNIFGTSLYPIDDPVKLRRLLLNETMEIDPRMLPTH